MVELTFYWSLFFSQFVDVKRKVVKFSEPAKMLFRIFGRCSSTTSPPLPSWCLAGLVIFTGKLTEFCKMNEMAK